jgi:murein DD-endopeptidase MepM/ murein hydrolase activator NlpD
MRGIGLTDFKLTGRRHAIDSPRFPDAESMLADLAEAAPTASADTDSSRGGARRRARAAEVRHLAPRVADPGSDYLGRRFATGMRYGTCDPATRADGHADARQPAGEHEKAQGMAPGFALVPVADIIPLLDEAKPVTGAAAEAATGAEPATGAGTGSVPAASQDPSVDDNVIHAPARFRRPSLGWSHKIAAVAAVSGIALAAAYPSTGGEVEETARVAHTSSAVADVSVPANDSYKIVRTAVTSSFTKDDQLDYLMSASGGDITKVNTGGVLAQPVDQVRITSRFGPRVDPVSGLGAQVHIGQDYGVKCGTPVKAAAEGTVVQAGWAGHSGNRVRVDHGNGLETTYNHNTGLKVSVGDRVERGDVVALSGTTGNSTGCHLHFEVLVDGDAVDPARWL